MSAHQSRGLIATGRRKVGSSQRRTDPGQILHHMRIDERVQCRQPPPAWLGTAGVCRTLAARLRAPLRAPPIELLAFENPGLALLLTAKAKRKAPCLRAALRLCLIASCFTLAWLVSPRVGSGHVGSRQVEPVRRRSKERVADLSGRDAQHPLFWCQSLAPFSTVIARRRCEVLELAYNPSARQDGAAELDGWPRSLMRCRTLRA